GLAPLLGSQHGAGESARLSSAFHAKCAGELAPGQWEALTDEEQKELSTWHPPGDCQPEKGPLLRDSEALKEIPVGLTEDFGPCEPLYQNPDGSYKWPDHCLTGGAIDFLWVVDAKDGTRVVFVADIKRRRFTATDGPES